VDSETRNTILLVDDDLTALKMRSLILQQEGYNVLAAASGKEAVALFSNESVDLVISDHLLQGDDGGVATLQMKSLKSTIPVILLSGLPQQPEGTEHVDAYFVKGGAVPELLSIVRRLLLPEPSN
jgi:CheY-like chemotaxis protein